MAAVKKQLSDFKPDFSRGENNRKCRVLKFSSQKYETILMNCLVIPFTGYSRLSMEVIKQIKKIVATPDGAAQRGVPALLQADSSVRRTHRQELKEIKPTSTNIVIVSISVWFLYVPLCEISKFFKKEHSRQWVRRIGDNFQ